MNLINDNEGDSLDVVAGLPGSGHAIPLLGRRDDQIGLGYGPHVWCYISRQLNHPGRERMKALTSSVSNQTWMFHII